MEVFIAMPAHRAIPVPTVLSLIGTLAACNHAGIRTILSMPINGSVVTSARNKAAHEFLKSNLSHLFWIDSDMQWEPDSFFRVLEKASQGKPVVCVSYPMRREPICFDQNGIGFTCVERKVIEALAAKAPLIYYGEHEPCREIFHESHSISDREQAGADYTFLAEDATFFAESHIAGFPAFLMPDIEIGHVGEKVYRGRLLDYAEEA